MATIASSDNPPPPVHQGRPNGTPKKRPADEAEGSPEKAKRRSKYTRRACDDCRRRKVKKDMGQADPPVYPRPGRLIAGALGHHPPMLVEKKRGWSGEKRAASDLPKPQSQYPTPSEADSDGETDTFEMRNCGGSNMSLRSKLEVLHEALEIDFPAPSASTPRTQAGDHSVSDGASSGGGAQLLSLELPSPPKLRRLLDIFFADHDPFIPCVSRTDFESRLLKWISDEAYGTRSRTLTVFPSRLAFGALVCMVLAVSSFIDTESSLLEAGVAKASQKPGSGWYRKAMSLLRHACRHNSVDLDLVRLYTLQAIYLHYTEQLGEASQAVSLAISLSIRGGLNDQTSFDGCSPAEILARRKVWWTLYYVDRRIAEKCGQPYYMRDLEIDVDDFSRPPQDDGFPESPSGARARMYFQSMIDWARLWTQVWDTFFALKARCLGDPDEIEAMDARIKAMSQALPPELTWETASFDAYVRAGEDQRDIRYRLLTFTRTNLLRMTLRHNPLMDNQDDVDTMRFCAAVSTETIEAVVVYINTYYCVGQLGHFTASTLVECICHLIPSLAVSLPQADRDAAIWAMSEVQRLLRRISQHRAVARRAEKVLEHVFDAVGRMSHEQESNSSASAPDLRNAPFDDTSLVFTPGSTDLFGDWLAASFPPNRSFS
ncbi:hypothetical protein MKZ38_000909 [Zalerion maritima]|uniref:Xylanolytic transcriptional activator regulatory domain-containing protein n=1 Tax=Zalerion maritima TaxID=339359 RepID=A0AAD5RFP6_9PEZI|nr:hypothetical protein MKZ38_000909 [Zalerion maritima]